MGEKTIKTFFGIPIPIILIIIGMAMLNEEIKIVDAEKENVIEPFKKEHDA